MKVLKLSANKTVDEVCKEIEKMIPCVLGTKPNKTKEDKAIVYYPARRFAGTDDGSAMDDIRIVVRKVNNSMTSIKLLDMERREKIEPIIKEIFGENWRTPAIKKAHSALERVLKEMFSKESED